jgi:hypothetical protein
MYRETTPCTEDTSKIEGAQLTGMIYTGHPMVPARMSGNKGIKMKVGAKIDKRKDTLLEHWRVTSLAPAIVVALSALYIQEVNMVEAGETITIGAVEEVVLFPWGIKLPARIDTGATKSCLDARDVRIDRGMAEFRLPEKYGGALLRVPVKGRRNIRSAGGSMKRPIVEIELCIGTKRILTTVNLTDRSEMNYPLLIGRNVLVNNFLVDVSKSHLLPTTCLSGTPK